MVRSGRTDWLWGFLRTWPSHGGVHAYVGVDREYLEVPQPPQPSLVRQPLPSLPVAIIVQ